MTPPFDSRGLRTTLAVKREEAERRTHLPKELVALACEAFEAFIQCRELVHFDDARFLDGIDLEKAALGAPLLPRADFPLEMENVQDMFAKTLAALKRNRPELESAVRGAMKAKRYSLDAAVKAFLAGDEAFFAALGETTPDAPRTFFFLTRMAVLPSLHAAGGMAAEKRGLEKPSLDGTCPVCGSFPLIARFEGKEGRRMSTCSFCLHEYRAPRMGCALCGVEEAKEAQVRRFEDEPGWRLELCPQCRCYLKTADFREYDKAYLPLIDDLITLLMDAWAAKEGWSRSTVSGFGF